MQKIERSSDFSVTSHHILVGEMGTLTSRRDSAFLHLGIWHNIPCGMLVDFSSQISVHTYPGHYSHQNTSKHQKYAAYGTCWVASAGRNALANPRATVSHPLTGLGTQEPVPGTPRLPQDTCSYTGSLLTWHRGRAKADQPLETPRRPRTRTAAAETTAATTPLARLTTPVPPMAAARS